MDDLHRSSSSRRKRHHNEPRSQRRRSSRRSKRSRELAAHPQTAIILTSTETSVTSHKEPRRSSSSSKKHQHPKEDDRRQEMLKQRSSRRRSRHASSSKSLTNSSKRKHSRQPNIQLAEEVLPEESHSKLKMVSKLVQELEQDDLVVIGKMLGGKHSYSKDEEEQAGKNNGKKKAKHNNQKQGKMKKLSSWFQQLSMTKKYGLVACLTFGFTAIIATCIILLALATGGSDSSNANGSSRNPVMDIIKYAPLLTGNVTIGSLPDATNPYDFYLNINFVNFSIFDQEELVLYITRGSNDTLEETIRIQNHVRFESIALLKMPLLLPNNFWPGEYNAIVLSDESKDGRLTELVQSPLEVLDDDRDYLQPSGAPTTSAAPTERPSVSPTNRPSVSPTYFPTYSPSNEPSNVPSVSPTTSEPSVSPTNYPTITPRPTTLESEAPTDTPSQNPTANGRLARLEEILVPAVLAQFPDTGNNSPQGRAIQWLDTGSGKKLSLKTTEREVLQLYALVVQRFATAPNQWILDPSKSLCDWNGVICNSDKEVIQLELQNKKMQGSLVMELGILTSLTILNLSENQLTGRIPTQLQQLTKLQMFHIGDNRLTGPVPDMSNNQGPLQVLNLGNNAGLTGNLESIATGLPRSIQEFSCQACVLGGMIPIEFRSLQQLTKLQLQEAGLVGTIPSNLAALPALQELYLGGNQLTGKIHHQFGTMSNLQVLDLSANQIAGSLTTQLGSLVTLKTLNLSGNVIPGVIPVEIVSMPMLQKLDMSNNQLVGSLPRLVGRSLVSVNVSGNPGVIGNFGTIFSGASETFVDFSCAQCSLQGDGIADSIQALNLEATGLTGPIGNLLNSLKFGNLLRLELGHNSLTGQIPNQLFSNQRLQAIRLNNNLLSGPIPSFANGATLQLVDLSNNPGLVGDTTAIFGSFQPSMTQFSCNNCKFSGPLSDAAVASLRNLEILELENAGVGGSLPAALGSLTGLTTLNLINNGLSGTIPQSLTSSSKIKRLLLAKNLLSASLTSFTGKSLEVLSLDENLAITGSLNVFFSTVSKTLAEFYCEKCSISGTIPGQLLRELSNLRALKLEEVGLRGSLPAQFGVLSKLTSLELGGNSLVGSIPEAIADLPQLVKVELHDNQLVGDLPVFSSNSLQILILNDNVGIRGNVEAFLNSLPASSMTQIQCEDCILDGSIPTTIASFSNLEALRLDKGGAIGGSLPSELGMLTKLTLLDMSNNVVTGVIPTQFGFLRALTTLDLDRNLLRGVIPAQLGDLSVLSELFLGVNGLTGTIPQKVAALPALEDLYLGTNRLFGQLPAFTGESFLYINLDQNDGLEGNLGSFFGSVTDNLLSFSCEECDLPGAIPPNLISTKSSLESLKLEDCDLVGTIPGAFASLVSLTSLELGKNELVGQIPTELLLLSKLEILKLNENFITGTLPAFKTLANLRVLDLAQNDDLVIDAFTVFPTLPTSLTELYFDGIPLLGTLPYNGISVLPSLEYLGVEGCNLYGRLPELTGLENITSIRFGGNDLSGTIPATIGQLAKLEVLELWDNDIFGTVPSFAGNQNGLREIDLSFNIGIIGNLMDILNKLPESLMDFRCEQCGLVGQIPGATILKFKNLTAIQVEENGLTGSLPTEFGTLTMMSRLSLGSNSLIGSIPTQIANLPRLEIFDVWGNQLTGIVPSFAQNDGYLNYFDIEENQLRGSLQGLIRSLPPESLSKFYAGYNSLTGFIPSDIAYFPKLTLFYIRWQNIGGTVPLQMAFMNKLEHMNIEGNSISGNFPADIAKMTNMVDLSIHANRFKGSLDTACDVNRIPEELTADCANPVAVSCSCCSACWSQNSNSWA